MISRTWIVALTIATASAQPFDSKLFSAWQWRSIGPVRGGRSIAVAGSPSRPLEYYMGTVGGGLWKTSDGGSNWAPVSDGFFHSAAVGSVAVCEANPDVVYAGMGEGDWRAQMGTGDGAYASRDGGKTWTHIGLASSTGQQTIPALRVDSSDCNTVFAAVMGDPHGRNPERGIFRTTDGGKTWTKILYRGDDIGAIDLAVDRADPKVMYAALWNAIRTPWGGQVGSQSGIFKTTDRGETWTELTHNPGIPPGRIGKIGLAIGANSSRVYALLEMDPDAGGVFRSDDGGAHWGRINGDHTLTSRAEYYTRIFADPKLPDRVYVMNKEVYRSDDAGKTYRPVRTPHGDNHDLWIDPKDSDRMVESNDGGAVVTFNGGRSWSEERYSTAQIYHVITTPGFPYLVCGSEQDNTSKCLPSDGEGTFWYEGPAGEQGYIALDPRQPTVGYGGSQRGEMVRYDRATGQRQRIDVSPRVPGGETSAQEQERFQWTFPIIMSPRNPDVIYAGSQHVWRTTDGGHSWKSISPDLTRADPKTLLESDEPVNEHNSQDTYATVFSIAVSPIDDRVIWAGSDDGLVHVTRDSGAHWDKVTPPGLPEFAKVTMIAASPNSAGKAYVTAERHKMQDRAPYIFRTSDYGRTWTKIVDGIASNAWADSVKEDPKRPGLLFAGTEHGAYMSVDDGARWQPLSLNLPDVEVSDVKVHNNDLVISTFGRGLYILDDISPLRELNGATLEQTHLFRPADVIRTASTTLDGGEYRRTVLPGANRVNIFYFLRQPAQRVSLEILDAKGQVVRRFEGTPGGRPRPQIRNSVGDVVNSTQWGSASAPPVVRVAPGLNRVAWDLRLPPAADFPGLLLRDTNVDGPVVPPGQYQVRLTVDGEPQTQSFTISKDPRLKGITQADLEAQFDFERRVHKWLNDAISSVVEIRAIKAQIDDRIRRAAALRTSGDDLKARLSEVEGTIYQVHNETTSDIMHWGPRLADKLAEIYAVVKSADAVPTEPAQEALAELSAQLDTQLSKLEKLLKSDVAAFNQQVTKESLPPIRPGAN